MPLVVIRSPYLFKKMKPLSWCLSFSQERASFCRALGMYIRRSLPPFEYKSKCPSLMCSTLICMSSLTRAPVAARKRITKYQNSSSSRLRQVLKYSYGRYNSQVCGKHTESAKAGRFRASAIGVIRDMPAVNANEIVYRNALILAILLAANSFYHTSAPIARIKVPLFLPLSPI